MPKRNVTRSAQASQEPQPQAPQKSRVSRRSVLRGAAGAGAAGLAGAALGTAALGTTAAAASPASSAAAPETSRSRETGDPIVVHVRDARAGDIEVFSGTSQTSLRDRDLAARIARAIG
jgi:anaerobic selenocysteine-containing dehydrogenase